MSKIEAQDLGVLSLTDKMFVSCLPKEANAVVVRYDLVPGIRISCVIPPQTMHIRINQETWNYGGKKRIKRFRVLLKLG